MEMQWFVKFKKKKNSYNLVLFDFPKKEIEKEALIVTSLKKNL